MVLSIVFVVFFTVPMYFLGNILFITQLKLSLDSQLLSNQNNGFLEYSLFAYGPYQGLNQNNLFFTISQILK